MNPVVSLESKLSFQLASADIATPVNTTTFVPGKFVNNRDGSYNAHYMLMYLALYGICVQFEDKKLVPCPINIHVLEGKASHQYSFFWR
jgi:hypothetical protein